jgi:hypothetical protein
MRKCPKGIKPDQDNYFGSGKNIKRAIKKYGIDSFSKEILYESLDRDFIADKEKQLVNSLTVSDSQCYNMRVGGYGGWDHVNKDRTSAFYSEIGKRGYKEGICKLTKHERSLRSKKSAITRKKTNFKHEYSAEQRERMSKSHKGSKNSQYGTVWCIKETSQTNTKHNRKKFKYTEIPKGWITTQAWKEKNDKRDPKKTRSWYNDGNKSFLLLPDDVRIKLLSKGRI